MEDIRKAFADARELGFDNINMDLIVGLPGEGIEEVEHTMQEVLSLDPDSITVHSLAIKRAARLNLFKDEYKEMTFTNNQRIMEMTEQYAAKAGMFPYYLYRQKNMKAILRMSDMQNRKRRHLQYPDHGREAVDPGTWSRCFDQVCDE